uniref:Reverse transcriptase zinc-binding domain-containing protein n=1 Tax=Triticum urartu TaxID=4572 RepID=A0A8R7R7U8_TRIUA
WGLGPKSYFTTRSVYAFLERHIVGCNYNWIWRASIPLKIQIFMWQLSQNAKCSFCAAKETS